MEAFWRREKPEAFRHVIRLCARADSSQGIFILFEVNLKKIKLLVCTLICSYCLFFFPAPHAPDLVINFFKPSSAFIGLSLESRKRSHTQTLTRLS